MTKATRTTVNSVLFATPVVAEGEVLATEARNEFVTTQGNLLAELFLGKTEDTKLVFDIIAAAKKQLPVLVKAAAEAEANKVKAAAAEKAKTEQEQAKSAALLAETIEATRKLMFDKLTEAGMSPEMIEKHLSTLIQLPKEKTSYDSVEVEYNGERFEFKVKGNYNQKAKDALAATGLSREAFIEQYKVKAEA